MQAVFNSKKDLFSTWLIIIFVFVLLATAAYTKYFNIPGAQDLNLERIRILFNPNDLENINKIELKNRLGQFTVQSFNSEKMGKHWLLTSPRRLFANTKTINTMLKILEDIRIKKVYKNDEINRANFSLNNPNVELTLGDKTGGKLKISIGLINPIDNSTYLLSSDSDAIFHIQSLPSIIEKLNFSDFVDSNISNLAFREIKRIQILKKDNRSAQLDLIADTNNEWTSKEGRLLSTESVEKYYEELMQTQTHLILDVTNEEQQEAIDKLLEKPIYRFVVTTKNNKEIDFKVSSLIYDIPGLRIEKKKYVLIQSSNKDYPYVYNKDILKKFYATQYSFTRRKR